MHPHGPGGSVGSSIGSPPGLATAESVTQADLGMAVSPPQGRGQSGSQAPPGPGAVQRQGTLGMKMDAAADDGSSTRSSRAPSFDNVLPDFAVQQMAAASGQPPVSGGPAGGSTPGRHRTSGSSGSWTNAAAHATGLPPGLILRRNDSTASEESLEAMAEIGGIRVAQDGTLNFDMDGDLDFGDRGAGTQSQ